MEKLKLILTNPCSRDWDGLEVASNGRYCDSCEKNVVDLTGKSDAELISFFKRKNENICGRLLPNQLNRTLVMPATRTNWNWLLPLAVGTMFISPSRASEFKPVAAQQSDHGFTVLPVIENMERKVEKVEMKTLTIKGKVVADESGTPLKGVKIRQKGFQNVLAITDSSGNFEVNLPKENKTVTLSFQLEGYVINDAQPVMNMLVKLKTMVIRIGGVSMLHSGNEPLYIVRAGKRACAIDDATFKQIQPDWIDKVDILKDASATAIYGSKAANGVIIIEIKKAFAKKVDFSKKKIRD